MNVSYRRLQERAHELGNHFNRHYLTLEKHLSDFLDELGRARVQERLDLWRPARNPRKGFKLIRKISPDRQQGLAFARTYFAVQHILLIQSHVDALRLSIAAGEEPIRSYHRFVLTLGDDFIRLSNALLECLVRHMVPSARKLKWSLLGVGTLRDQDDIDVALVDDGSKIREQFNLEMSRVAHEMLRSASPLHFYLAERLGQGSYSVPLDQYVRMVDKEWHDHVLMSEIANTTFLLGSKDIFHDFMSQVVHRYFRERGTENPYHEVFVRGLTGEIRSLLFGHLSDKRINPKYDALRIIKMAIHVFWSIHGIKDADPWKVLKKLETKLSGQKEVFARLRDDLSFLETLRTLFQLFSIQEEEIDVATSADALERVAETMGYSARGVLQAHQLLLVDYYDHVDSARCVAQELVGDVRRHLQRTSRIHKLIRFDEDYRSANLAKSFVERIRWFPGNRYWLDVLNALEEPELTFIKGLARDFYRLNGEERAEVVKGFLSWAQSNLVAWMHFTRLLAEAGEQDTRTMRRELNEIFLESGGTRYFQTRLGEVLHLAPDQFHHYIDRMSPSELDLLARLVSEPDVFGGEPEEQTESLEAVAFAVDAYLHTSRFFSRNLRTVVAARPECLERLADQEFLQGVAQGLKAEAAKAHALARRREMLVLYFRVEYLRTALLLLNGAPLETVHRQYTECTDVFLTSLYRLARRETEKDVASRAETRDRAAIFATGSRGREEAFDDDIDVIVISEEMSDSARQLFRRILGRMNQQIMRLGIIPQYRMADHFGEYMAPLDTVAEYLLSDRPQIYLDMTEFLELRMIEGNTHFEEKIHKTLVDEIIFDRKRDYLLSALVTEIEDRRAYFKNSERARPDTVNVKEYPGGLREIELVLIFHKVLRRLHDHVNLQLFDHLADKVPEKAEGFRWLKNHFLFLKRLRHLNRILVSADDVIRPARAEILGPYSTGHNGERLMKEIRARMKEAAAVVKKLIET
jgi:hypothetical protein